MLEGEKPFVPGELYQVFSSGTERITELGFARAEKLADIEAFFDERKGYGLVVKPIREVTVPCGLAERKKELRKKLSEMDLEMSRIRRELQGL